jgi:hypothetical protein
MKKLSLLRILKEAVDDEYDDDVEHGRVVDQNDLPVDGKGELEPDEPVANYQDAPFVKQLAQYLKRDEIQGKGGPYATRKLFFKLTPELGFSVINGAISMDDWEVMPIKNGEMVEDHLRRMNADEVAPFIQSYIKRYSTPKLPSPETKLLPQNKRPSQLSEPEQVKAFYLNLNPKQKASLPPVTDDEWYPATLNLMGSRKTQN